MCVPSRFSLDTMRCSITEHSVVIYYLIVLCDHDCTRIWETGWS